MSSYCYYLFYPHKFGHDVVIARHVDEKCAFKTLLTCLKKNKNNLRECLQRALPKRLR